MLLRMAPQYLWKMLLRLPPSQYPSRALQIPKPGCVKQLQSQTCLAAEHGALTVMVVAAAVTSTAAVVSAVTSTAAVVSAVAPL